MENLIQAEAAKPSENLANYLNKAQKKGKNPKDDDFEADLSQMLFQLQDSKPVPQDGISPILVQAAPEKSDGKGEGVELARLVQSTPVDQSMPAELIEDPKSKQGSLAKGVVQGKADPLAKVRLQAKGVQPKADPQAKVELQPKGASQPNLELEKAALWMMAQAKEAGSQAPTQVSEVGKLTAGKVPAQFQSKEVKGLVGSKFRIEDLKLVDGSDGSVSLNLNKPVPSNPAAVEKTMSAMQPRMPLVMSEAAVPGPVPVPAMQNALTLAGQSVKFAGPMPINRQPQGAQVRPVDLGGESILMEPSELSFLDPRSAQTMPLNPLTAKPGQKVATGPLFLKSQLTGGEYLSALNGTPQKEEKEVALTSTAAPLSFKEAEKQKMTAEISGQVVPGAMSKDRLSTDSLNNLTSQIRMASNQGGGEVKIRLRPEHLGELHVRISTDGAHVGLQIQASDEKAKKVIEESLRFLQESLTGQSLTLAKVELSVGHFGEAHRLADAGLDQKNFNQQNGFQDSLGQNAQNKQQQNSSSREYQNEWEPRAGLSQGRGGSIPRMETSINGRIDVMA